jgi:hypothetical protein
MQQEKEIKQQTQETIVKPARLMIASALVQKDIRNIEEYVKQVNEAEEGAWAEVVKAVVDARFAIEDALKRAQLAVEHETGVYVCFPNPERVKHTGPRWTGD